ncbi:hypothetical protein FH609_008845 [Streptomyces sp. 3MP-14]|uniref:NACHT domain-containing protein n=1 Tax=Streptomyces mimosae TaxID=2586635 RepID=A0A5N6AKD8_9ACTN|nr:MULTISPECIES: hypothetical protein [Streptomyces]KAB8168523.1 hypothetical protein FH607_004520 [Streptomyces mimosae]KAB8178196.1 hypothetical protein FH609_008845 [Streptomyces sp. 3MP-14]
MKKQRRECKPLWREFCERSEHWVAYSTFHGWFRSGRRVAWSQALHVVRILGLDENVWRARWAAAESNDGRGARISAQETSPPATERVGSPLPPVSDVLLAAADELAADVESQWRTEARAQQLFDPAIPVPWGLSALPVTSPVERAVEIAQQPIDVPPLLPGTTPVTLDGVRGGELEDLPLVYGALPSGRVVILGRSGSGKSGAAIGTLLRALERRRGLRDEDRAQTPVPVLLDCRDWEADREELYEWLARRLAADYPRLRARRRKQGTLAAQLARSGRVSLFLEGFDELAPDLRATALEAIDRQAALRLVLLSRTDEFEKAVGGTRHLSRALALELLPVRPREAAEYLRRCHVAQARSDWQRLTGHIEASPDSPVSRALSSPLALMLLRRQSEDHSVVERLLRPESFGSRDEVEDFLLDGYLPAVWKGTPEKPLRTTSEEARTCLGYLAARMTEDASGVLSWQLLHRWQPWLPRVLATGLLGMTATALVATVVFGPLGQYTVRGSTGSLFGLWYGGFLGALFGLVAAAASELPRLPVGRLRAAEGARLSSFNVRVCLLLTLAMGIAVGNQTHYLYGAVAGPVVGAVAGAAAARTWPAPRGLPRRCRLLRLRLDPVTGAAAGLAAGAAYGVTNGAVNGAFAGLTSALAFGLMAGVTRPSAQGDFSDPHTLWRRDRQRSLTVGIAAGTVLGIALGVRNGIAHGALAGVVAGVGIGLLVAAACAVGVSDAWRARLTFLQLRLRGVAPPGGPRILWEAGRCNVLRGQGPALAFQHLRLQERLASDAVPSRGVIPPSRPSGAPSRAERP